MHRFMSLDDLITTISPPLSLLVMVTSSFERRATTASRSCFVKLDLLVMFRERSTSR